MEHWKRFIDDLARTNSISSRITTQIKQQFIRRLAPHNLPDWDEFDIKLKFHPNGLELRVHVELCHPSGISIQPYTKTYGDLNSYTSDLNWKSAKDHFQRSIIRDAVSWLDDGIMRPSNRGLIGIDLYLYDYLRQWLTNSQILEFLKTAKTGYYKIVSHPDEKLVSRINASIKGLVLSAKFGIAPRLSYNQGEVFIPGYFPMIMADNLIGKDIYSVIEAEPFKGRGKILRTGRQKVKLRLVIERETVSLAELTNRAATEKRPRITHAIQRI